MVPLEPLSVTPELHWKDTDPLILFGFAVNTISGVLQLNSGEEGVIPTVVECGSMPEAVKSAYYLGDRGDAILLSPACASFDLFSNYEERGRVFKDCVRSL